MHREEKELKPSQKSRSKVGLQKTTSIIKLIPILILLFVSFAVYFNAIFGDFVYDDQFQIVENRWITDIKFIPEIFSRGFWEFSGSSSNFYRPLVHMVYLVDYHVFGLHAWGFHLVNILFHMGNTVLVFLIISRLYGKSEPLLSPPFISALLFAVHPIHTEAVTWISGSDHTFTFFVLLSFYLYIRSFKESWVMYLFSLVSFLFAVLFKETALTFPIILCVYDYAFRRADFRNFDHLKRYIPYLTVAGVYFGVRLYILKGLVPQEHYLNLSNYESVINVFPLFVHYLEKLLLPVRLNIVHVFHPITSIFEPMGIVSVIVALIFGVFAGIAYRSKREIFFCLSLILIPLLPVFYIKGIGVTPFAERYLYLPSIGFVFLLAISLYWVKEKLPGAAKSITIVFIIIVGLYSVETINRNNVWKDNFTLWSDTVKKSPDSATAHYNLAHEYASKGLTDMAIAECQMALRLEPYFTKAHNGLGIAYKSKGLLDMAIAEFQTVLRLDPSFADAHNNLGNVYSSKGLIDMAIAEYQMALRLKPESAKIHYNLGEEYSSKGLTDMAIAEYQMALSLTPDLVEPHYNLAVIYLQRGNADMARIELEQALHVRPDFNEARILLNYIISKQQ